MSDEKRYTAADVKEAFMNGARLAVERPDALKAMGIQAPPAPKRTPMYLLDDVFRSSLATITHVRYPRPWAKSGSWA